MPRFSKGALLLSVGASVIGLFVCLLAGRHLYQSHLQYQQQAEIVTQNLAKTLELTVSGTLDGIDRSLCYTVGTVESQLRQGAIKRDTLHDELVRQRQLLPELESLILADADGKVICGDGPLTINTLTVADRDYAIQAKADVREIAILSKPVMSKLTGQLILVIARRVNGPDHSFAGIIAGAVPIDRFRAQFTPVDLGERGQIGLRGADFSTILTVPNIVAVGDRRASQTTLEMLKIHPQASTYQTRRAADGVECVVSFRRLSRYPLYIVVSKATEEYLTGWWHEMTIVTVLLVVFLAALLVMSTVIRRSWQQALAAGQVARQSAQELRDCLGFLPVPVSIALTMGRSSSGISCSISPSATLRRRSRPSPTGCAWHIPIRAIG